MPYFSIQSPASGNALQLQGRSVSSTGPTGGQVLTWDGSSWVPAVGTTGPTGAAGLDGGRIYSGTTGPISGLGRSGDYFIDFAAGVLYGPKANNAWGSGLQLASGQQGPTGPAGSGSTGPTGVGTTGPAGGVGPTGASVTGPTGAASNVTGPTGASVTGPTGAASSVTGPTGPFPSILIGTVTSGSTPSATLTPTAPGVTVLSLVLARGSTGPSGAVGATGPANAIAIGTVDDGGSAGASLTPDGTGGQLLNLVLPAGPTGAASIVTGPTGATGVGPTGPTGAASDVIGPTGPAGVGSTGPTGAASQVTGPTGPEFILPVATSSVLGGIKVGSNLTITDGVLSAAGGGGAASINYEYATPAALPAQGNAALLYCTTDTGRLWRWTGSVWVEVGPVGGGGFAWSAVPASATATGTAGQIAYDGNLYVCTAANTWAKFPGTTSWTNFAPTSISGLVGWFDASDATTMYDATSGGSTVDAGSPIARWADKSGSGNHALQSTSGSRPTRRAAGLGGKPSVQFVADTADNGDWLGIASTSALNGASGLGVFVVYLTASVGVNRGLVGKWPGPGEETAPAWLLGYTGTATGATTATHLMHNGTSAASAATTSNFNDGSPRLLGLVNTSAGLQARMNGASQGTNSSTVAPSSGGTAGVVIGGYCGYSLASGQALMSAHISELLIYSATLTSQQVSDIEAYLMTKWGVS